MLFPTLQWGSTSAKGYRLSAAMSHSSGEVLALLMHRTLLLWQVQPEHPDFYPLPKRPIKRANTWPQNCTNTPPSNQHSTIQLAIHEVFKRSPQQDQCNQLCIQFAPTQQNGSQTRLVCLDRGYEEGSGYTWGGRAFNLGGGGGGGLAKPPPQKRLN